MARSKRKGKKAQARAVALTEFFFRRYGGLLSIILGLTAMYSSFLFGFLDNLGYFSVMIDANFVFSEVVSLTVLLVALGFAVRVFQISMMHSHRLLENNLNDASRLDRFFSALDILSLLASVFFIIWVFYLDFRSTLLLVLYGSLSAWVYAAMLAGAFGFEKNLMVSWFFQVSKDPIIFLKKDQYALAVVVAFALGLFYSTGNLRFNSIERNGLVSVQVDRGLVVGSLIGKSGSGIFLSVGEKPKFRYLIARDRNIRFIPFANVQAIFAKDKSPRQ